MADESVMNLAKATYKTMCGKLDEMGWKYDKFENDLVIRSGSRGDDLPMEFVVKVNPETQLVTLVSKMPYKIAEDKRIDMAVAVCAANHGLVDGRFDYDVLQGEIFFCMTLNFRDSNLGGEAFEYMVIVSCRIMDKYNDRFLMLSKGELKVEDFLAANKR